MPRLDTESSLQKADRGRQFLAHQVADKNGEADGEGRQDLQQRQG